jgi:hypothetical protein
MSGWRIRHFVTAIAGIVAAAIPLWWFVSAAVHPEVEFRSFLTK